MNRDIYSIKLRIKLMTDWISDKEMENLLKYGHANEGISRDFIVPGDITLHALHYIIQKAFGWQNYHLHKFCLPEYTYKLVTKGNKASRWCRLCGVYFRFPSDDYDDIFWDDDYEEGKNFNTWLRKKYTAPYLYKGRGELYSNCRGEAELLLDDIRNFRFREIGHQYTKDLTIREIEETVCFEGSFDELLERLPLADVLLMPGDIYDEAEWLEWLLSVDDDYKLGKFSEMPKILPVAHDLIYTYDYGDNWRLQITAMDSWKTKEAMARAGYDYYLTEKGKPYCIAADGLSLVEDAGGVHGFADMLHTLSADTYDMHFDTDEELNEFLEERRKTRIWAESLGWKDTLPAIDKLL